MVQAALFNSMAYILDLIIMIMARMLAIILEDRMRYRLDDFNRCSSTPETANSAHRRRYSRK